VLPINKKPSKKVEKVVKNTIS